MTVYERAERYLSSCDGAISNGYPRFLRELLCNCPQAGQGVHQWLFKVARYLHRYHTPKEICAILQARTADCRRAIDPHEIVDAVSNSGACKWEPNGKTAGELRAEWLKNPTTRRVPVFDPDLALRTASRVPVDVTPEWLKDRSPVAVTLPTQYFLEAIFGPQEGFYATRLTVKLILIREHKKTADAARKASPRSGTPSLSATRNRKRSGSRSG